jgi:hypothetical protein
LLICLHAPAGDGSAATTFGAVTGIAQSGSAVWVASQHGLFKIPADWSADAAPVRVSGVTDNVTAVTAAPDGGVVAGSYDRIWFVDASGSVTRWEWTTDVPDTWGGVVGGAVTTLTYGPSMASTSDRDDSVHEEKGSMVGSDLFVGNPRCLNVRREKTGWFERVGPDQVGDATTTRVTVCMQLASVLIWQFVIF